MLHDTHLHHARAAFLLRERRAADYRTEFIRNHPGVAADAAELGVAGFDSVLYYQWPMVRALVESARLVAVHGNATRRSVIESLSGIFRLQPEEKIVSIRLGHGQLVTADQGADARRRIRAKYGIADDAVVFICAGGITPEKRIPQVLAALRATLAHAPSARLVLAGATAAHYDVRGDIAAHGLGDHVIVTGYLESDAELTDHLAAADVSLNLRWPTAGETSGPWLRALGAGVATVITDLVHLGDVPSVDPRTWGTNGLWPICVAIDILDEDHSLRLAMRRLATDADLRATLGRAGQEYWQREHSLERMVEDYERVIAAAPEVRPTPRAHEAGDEKLEALLAPLGVPRPW